MRFEGCVEDDEFSRRSLTFGANLVAVESNEPEFPEGEESWAQVLFSKIPASEAKDLANGVRFTLTISEDGVDFQVIRWAEADRERLRSPETIARVREMAKVFGLDPDEQEAYHRSLFDKEDLCDDSSS